MAEVVDAIIAQLEIRGIQQYEQNYQRATKAASDHVAALKQLAEASRLADRMMTDRSARGTPGSAAAKEANAAVAAVKQAAKDKVAAEKAAAREAADAVKAAERDKVAAAKATAREAAALAKQAVRDAEKRAAAEKAASEAVIAAAEREAAARARLAIVAQEAVDRRAAGIPRASAGTFGQTVPRDAPSKLFIPQGVLNGTSKADAAEAEVEREINHLLADDLSIRARLGSATGAEAAALRDQREELRLIAGYKRAGLTDDEAAVRIEADLAAIEKNRAIVGAEQRAANEATMRAQATRTGAQVSLLAPTLIGGIGLAEISHLNDKYIELTNALRVAGVATDDFDKVQTHLLATANRSGSDINALADVYRGAALSSHDLGASQADLLKITDAAANALRIQGRSSTEARGALLQLSHAFESGRVTAREFNSLALNLYPILQAVAKGSDEFGGSVAKLRAKLIDTGISSKDFFQALIRGSDDLAERASKATLTTAQGFTALTNSLVVYFGQADKANGVSAALGTALQKLAENLDILIPAITAIGTALAVGYVVRAAAAAAATEGLGAALLSAFGGPVGIAISAITLALAGIAVASHHSAEASQTLGGVTRATADAIAKLNNILVQDPSAAVAKNARELAAQRTAQANATFKAAEAEIALRRAQASAALKELQTNGREQTGVNRSGPQYTYYGTAGRRGVGLSELQLRIGVRQEELQQADKDQQSLNAAREAAARNIANPPKGDGAVALGAKTQARLDKLEGEIADLRKIEGGTTGARRSSIERQITRREQQVAALRDGASTGAASAAAYAGRGSAHRGPSVDTLARRAEAARVRGIRDDRQFDRELIQAQSGEASAAADVDNDPSARAQIERDRIREAAKLTAKEISSRGPKSAKGTGEYTEAEVKQLLAINSRTADLRVELVDQNERRRNADEQRSLDRADLENQRQALQAKQALAMTTEQRRDIAKQLLDLDYKQREAELEAVLAPDSKASDAEKVIARDRLALLPGQKAVDEKVVDRQNEGRGAAYLRGLSPDRGEFIQDEEVKALDEFNRGLDDSVKKALHLHGIFGDIVADLIDMAIKQALIKPLAGALFGGGDSGGGGGLGGLFGGIASLFGGGGAAAATGGGIDNLGGLSFGGLPSFGGGPLGDSNILSLAGTRASGGSVVGGSTYLVGEHGPELFRAPATGKIVPNNQAISTTAGAGGQITVHVEANDYFDARVAHVSGPIARNTSVQVVKAAAPRIVGAAVGQAPGAVRQEQTLRG